MSFLGDDEVNMKLIYNLKIITLLLVTLLFTGCPLDEGGVWYDGYKICEFQPVIKDINGTLYIPSKTLLYQVDNDEIIKSDKNIEEFLFKNSTELNNSNLSSATDIVKLITSTSYNSLDEIEYYRLFDISQQESPYIFGIVSYEMPNSSIRELVLVEKIDDTLYLKDHIIISRIIYSNNNNNSLIDDSHEDIEDTLLLKESNSGDSYNSVSDININSKYYLLLIDKQEIPKIVIYDNQHQKIKLINLTTFIDSYYQNSINFRDIFDYLKNNIAHESSAFDSVSYSIYSEGLYIIFPLNKKIKNSNLNEKIGPLPEGAYKSIYRFYSKEQAQNYIELQIPIDRNCTKDFL